MKYLLGARLHTGLCLSADAAAPAGMTPGQVLERLLAANRHYVATAQNPGDITAPRRADTAQNGQHPCAVVLTCSDSRVPPEHIFGAGVGDLFVVRTAGNVVGAFETGSVEYAVCHLGAPVILVLGHSGCGAVAAAMAGHGEGSIEAIVQEIAPHIAGCDGAAQAEDRNIAHAAARLLESDILRGRIEQGKALLAEAKYDIHSGRVTLFKQTPQP